MSNDEETRRIVRAHLDAWRNGDVRRLMADYADDAVLLSKHTGPLVGKAAIAAMYQHVFSEIFKTNEITFTAEPVFVCGDLALVHWGVTSSTLRTVGGFDTFFLRDGLIVAQTAGGEIIPLS